MAKIDKKVIMALVIIGIFILFMQPDKKEAQADVSAAKIDRSFSASEVKAGQTFTVTYTASNYGTGSWGVLLSDAVSGGCSPSSINNGFLGPDQTSTTATITAPTTAGTCTFTGTYSFGTSIQKAIQGSSSITITPETPVCSSSLRTSALNAIVAWINSPTSDNRAAALSAIVSWATVC